MTAADEDFTPALLRVEKKVKAYRKMVPATVDLTPRGWDRDTEFPLRVFDEFIKPIDKSLYRSGSKVVCPIHDDVNPSLQFYPDGGYHCFGCNDTGASVGELVEKVYRKHGFDPKPVLRCVGLLDEDKGAEDDSEKQSLMGATVSGWTSEDYCYSVKTLIKKKAPARVLVQAKLKYLAGQG